MVVSLHTQTEASPKSRNAEVPLEREDVVLY